MFEKNDRALFTVRTIVYVFIAFLAVFSLVAGIILAVKIHYLYFLIILGGWLSCFFLWVFARLFFSFLIDVKLIRNKLYGESNESFGIGVVKQKKHTADYPYED